jgi:hypothetical protein
MRKRVRRAAVLTGSADRIAAHQLRTSRRRPTASCGAPDRHISERPIALGHHRFEWLYVTGFVEPATGRTVWHVSNAISRGLFELVLADFAKSVGAGPQKRIVLQLDNAGWHGPETLAVPDGIRLVSSPPTTPSCRLPSTFGSSSRSRWSTATSRPSRLLDQAVGERCVALTQQQAMIRASTRFHWWPRLRVADHRVPHEGFRGRRSGSMGVRGAHLPDASPRNHYGLRSARNSLGHGGEGFRSATPATNGRDWRSSIFGWATASLPSCLRISVSSAATLVSMVTSFRSQKSTS